MLRTLAATTVAATALSLAGPMVATGYADPPVAPRAGSGLHGHWVGKVKNDTGSDSSYKVKVRIFTKGNKVRGQINYVGHCKGTWTFQRTHGDFTFFTEHITQDPGLPTCYPNVTVKVHRLDSQLKVKWHFHSHHATMLADRAS